MICFREIDQPEVLMTIEKTITVDDVPQLGSGTFQDAIGLGTNLPAYFFPQRADGSGPSIQVEITDPTNLQQIVIQINNYINTNSNTGDELGYTSNYVENIIDRSYTFTFTPLSCSQLFSAASPIIGFEIRFNPPLTIFSYEEFGVTNTSTCATYLTNCQNIKANLQVYNCCAAKKADEYIKLKKKGIDCSDKLDEITFLMGGIQALLGYDINSEENCITVEEVEEIMYKMSKICNDCSCKDYVNFQ